MRVTVLRDDRANRLGSGRAKQLYKAAKDGRLEDPIKITARRPKALSRNHGHRYCRYEVLRPDHFRFDKVSRKRGHEYLTLRYDLQRGERFCIGKDRTTDTLRRFFDELVQRCSRNLWAVCMDLWAPYRDVVSRRAPLATICFDRFHVVRHLLLRNRLSEHV